jgi:hypothetical protein
VGYLQKITRGNYSRIENRIIVSNRILNHHTCIPEVCQLGRNMYCPTKDCERRCT